MKCLTVFACLFAFATAQNLRGLQAIDDYDPNVNYSNGGTQDTQNNDYPQTTEEPPKGKMKIYGDDSYEPVYTAEQQKRLGVDKFGNSYGAGKNPMNPGQKKPQQSKNKWGQKGNSQQQQWGQKGNSQKQQWGQKGNSQKQQWGQKGNSQQNNNKWGQKGNNYQNKGKWTQQFYNKEHKCTVTKIPANLQTQYKSEFKALDVDNSGYLDSKEFKDEGAKISDAFSNFRKGKKPTWYNKGNKNGNNNQNGGRGGNQNGGQNNHNGGGFGGFGRGGNQNGGQHNQHGGRGRGNRGGRQLADASGSNFWEYLQHQGFVSQKPKQSTKDRMDSRRAAQVFKKFDQDHNNKVSLCEYENAMYRTEMLEKRMSGKKNNGIVVVHG